ncbi:MAG: DNA gyrase subunit A [Armatimonadetes bacterium 55-13]|mgnify:CR=1 FL=1|nr:DNA gyrase subunit A [Armatimonadota bacterium]OJU62223.1 MAG: DNA gyrase subunit A [Armatimonadetes bacterium 55-13]
MAEQDPNVSIVKVDEELGRSYVNYAMSVIIARALPDVRDGLKPVQRRILYAMRELNLSPDSNYVKCAKVTGQTSGDYHPHGDQVIYPTLVRMAQHWSLRYPLIQGQGNFGSVDGDSPAAQRYTECRLTPISMEMLEDLDRETVDWIDNYSTTLKEPTVLPSKFPNLLCNGSQGIAVGMATNLPPHNLTEVCNAALMRLDNPESTLDDVMTVMPGPDFPTYGIIMGTKGIRSAYETGRGSIIMQAKTMIEPGDAGKSVIVVTEIPYQVNKETLIKSIAAIAKERKFDGILNVQDYSDKRGMRIEIEVRRDVNPNKALNYLLKHTSLRTTFGAIMLGLADMAPRTCALLVLLDEYLKHRKQVVERRTRYELYRALEDMHLNEGYQIARRFLDDIINIIRNSADPGAARVALVREFDMSPFQANAVLNMQLRQLTRLNQQDLENRYKEALLKVQNLMDILNSPVRLKAVIREEIVGLRDKHGDERRTKIVTREAGEFTEEDLIPEEEAIISISRDGYIKRVSIDSYRQQKRGGKGVNNTLKADDEPAHLFQVNTHHTILFFTSHGRVYKLKAYEIPESGRYAKGMPVINYISIVGEERVTATISVKDLNAEGFLTMITRGTGANRWAEIKRTPMSAFANIRNNGLIAFDIEEGDELGWALKTRGNDDIILITHEGQSIRFNEKEATSRSRAAGGVRAIMFKESNREDRVVGADIVDETSSLLVVSENGYGKRTSMEEYRVQGRGGSGILTMNCTAKTGKIVGAEIVDDTDKLLVMTINGKGIRVRIKEIRTTGRVAQGVKLINLADNDQVRSIARLVQDTDDGDFEDAEIEDNGEETPEEPTEE